MHQQADVIVVFAQTDPGARHKGVGDDRMLGAASDGFKIAQTSLESGRTSTAACAVGIIQSCLDACVNYANQREQWGKPIAGHQLIQEMVADRATDCEAARLLTIQAAQTRDAGERATKYVVMAKQFATEAAIRAARTAISLHGGSSGYWRGNFGGGWEGSIRAPAIVRWPGNIPSGAVTDEIFATYDWMPTLAALVHESARMPSDRPIDGIDMSSFLLGQTDTSGREHFVFIGSDGELISVKWKTMKVHFRYTESNSWVAPYIKPQIPMVCDLISDP